VKPASFKAYDIRGRVGKDITEDFAERLGFAAVSTLGARRCVIGGDARESTPPLQSALARGLTAAGAEVIDIGLCGTEEVYFATSELRTDVGIMVTASHNPKADNGFKLVGRGAAPFLSVSLKP